MQKYYTMKVAGLNRDLPICPLNDKLSIAGFVMFGDAELTVAAAEELLKKSPEFDVILTAEAKGIPLAYEMSRQSGKPYVVARKKVAAYMKDSVSVTVHSITTKGEQTLYLSADKAEWLKDKRVVLVDDVISTGESLIALERLCESAGGTVAAREAVLAEGDAKDREDIIYLEPLPLFFNE